MTFRIPLAWVSAWLYLVGAQLVVAPWLYGFTDEVVPSLTSLGMGLFTLLVLVVSRMPGGLAKLLPPDMVELWSYLLAFGLVLLPFLPGELQGDDTFATGAFIASGIVTFLVIVLGAFPGLEGRDPRMPPELPDRAPRKRRKRPAADGAASTDGDDAGAADAPADGADSAGDDSSGEDVTAPTTSKEQQEDD